MKKMNKILSKVFLSFKMLQPLKLAMTNANDWRLTEISHHKDYFRSGRRNFLLILHISKQKVKG